MGKKIFVSVGSTHFDELIKIIDSKEFQEKAEALGYNSICAQIGKCNYKVQNIKNCFDYATPAEINQHFQDADLIISHAGAGTILEVLQIGKPLLVVTNDSLMNSHQSEIAYAFQRDNLIEMASTQNLMEVFEKGAHEPHKICFDCSSILNTIDDHFNFH